jgi:hypothetical protein
MPIVRSTYCLITNGPAHAYTPQQQRYRLIATLIEQASALLLLRYVMGRQGKARKDIGWDPRLSDVLRAIGLFAVSLLVQYFVFYQTQYLYYAFGTLPDSKTTALNPRLRNFGSVDRLCLPKPLHGGAYSSGLHNFGSLGSRRKSHPRCINQRPCATELSPLPGIRECSLADANVRGVFNLLRAKPQNTPDHNCAPCYGFTGNTSGTGINAPVPWL